MRETTVTPHAAQGQTSQSHRGLALTLAHRARVCECARQSWGRPRGPDASKFFIGGARRLYASALLRVSAPRLCCPPLLLSLCWARALDVADGVSLTSAQIRKLILTRIHIRVDSLLDCSSRPQAAPLCIARTFPHHLHPRQVLPMPSGTRFVFFLVTCGSAVVFVVTLSAPEPAFASIVGLGLVCSLLAARP